MTCSRKQVVDRAAGVLQHTCGSLILTKERLGIHIPWLIDLLIQLIVLAIVTTIVVFIIGYLAQPWSAVAVKIAYLIALIFFLLIVASFLTGWDSWPRFGTYHHSVRIN